MDPLLKRLREAPMPEPKSPEEQAAARKQWSDDLQRRLDADIAECGKSLDERPYRGLYVETFVALVRAAVPGHEPTEAAVRFAEYGQSIGAPCSDRAAGWIARVRVLGVDHPAVLGTETCVGGSI